MKWVGIGSGNGLSPVRRQAITWTSADFLSTGPLRKHFSEIRINKYNFRLWKCIWKCRLRNGGHFLQGIWVKLLIIATNVATVSFFYHHITHGKTANGPKGVAHVISDSVANILSPTGLLVKSSSSTANSIMTMLWPGNVFRITHVTSPLWERNPPGAGGFSSHRDSNADFLLLAWTSYWQTVKLLLIWDAMTLTWRHHNTSSLVYILSNPHATVACHFFSMEAYH